MTSSNEDASTVQARDAATKKPRRPRPTAAEKKAAFERFVVLAMCAFATLQLAWFYVICIPGFLYLPDYEIGQERMPFQTRMLMEFPLRWAHGSPFLIRCASLLAGMHLWKPTGIIAEDLLEFVVDAVALAIAGLATRALYRQFSKTQRFQALVYPLVLVMVVATYCVLPSHYFHFVYDLPSLALFAAAMLVIARRRSVLEFAAIFVVATINRETSIFLLWFFLAAAMVEGESVNWRRLLAWRSGGVAFALVCFWAAWHVWTARHFAGLPSEAARHMDINLVAILWPLMWPQLFAVAAFLIPVLLVFRAAPLPLELRLWMRVLPVWFAMMFVVGVIFEIRIFGELIPLLACAAALLADERLGGGVNSMGTGAIQGERCRH